jgi:heme-degrading monooxygenase HmoA
MSQIIRVFRAMTKPGQEEAFRSFFVEEAVPIVRRVPGLVSVQVGLPTEQSPGAFLMTTTWESLDALKGFAGENWQEAVIDPREAPLLQEVHVYHYLDAKV